MKSDTEGKRRSQHNLRAASRCSKPNINGYFTLAHMAVMFKRKIRSVGDDVEKLEPSHLAGGNVKPPQGEAAWGSLSQLHIGLPRDPPIPLLGLHPKE